MASESAGEKHNRFQPGVSGNPAGRPKGSRNRATLAAQALLDGESERLTRRAIELAHAGDTVALRLCLDRILPPRRERAVAVDLPEIVNADDAVSALGGIIKAVATGELTPPKEKRCPTWSRL
jgi:hypothetical protein